VRSTDGVPKAELWMSAICALTWRELPELEAVENKDFVQIWPDFPMPRHWPRD
jgi:hypothetical protein